MGGTDSYLHVFVFKLVPAPCTVPCPAACEDTREAASNGLIRTMGGPDAYLRVFVFKLVPARRTVPCPATCEDADETGY